MRIATITVSNTTTGTSQSSPYVVNWKANNFGIGMGLTMTASKGIGVDIEHTFDDPKSGLTNATWFKHSSLSSRTASADGNYAYPITAIRINITAQTSGNGSATLKIVQND